MNIEIATKLQKLRKDNGYSQEQLAEKLGISRQAVSKWERAEASPDTDNLICLAKLYNVSLDELLKTDESIEEIKETNIEKNNDNLDVSEKKHPILDALIPVSVLLIVITYLVIGSVWNLWHPWWLLFLFIPIVVTLIEAIKQKSVAAFAYPVLVVIVYLYLGFEHHIWHPTWVLYITIPIFYVIAGAIDKRNE